MLSPVLLCRAELCVHCLWMGSHPNSPPSDCLEACRAHAVPSVVKLREQQIPGSVGGSTGERNLSALHLCNYFHWRALH